MRGSNSEMLQNTDEMLACSSKMLQTARETDRTGDPKKLPKTEKTGFPKQFRILSLGNPLSHGFQCSPVALAVLPDLAGFTGALRAPSVQFSEG